MNFCLIRQKIWLHMFSTKNKNENRRNKEICISDCCEVYRIQVKLWSINWCLETSKPGDISRNQICLFCLYSFTVHVVIVHSLKNPTHALCFKIHTKTQSLFKTLECLRLLCHPTCFGHILDHLQGMFLVQCYFPPCCFDTILLGYVAVSSVIKCLTITDCTAMIYSTN